MASLDDAGRLCWYPRRGVPVPLRLLQWVVYINNVKEGEWRQTDAENVANKWRFPLTFIVLDDYLHDGRQIVTGLMTCFPEEREASEEDIRCIGHQPQGVLSPL